MEIVAFEPEMVEGVALFYRNLGYRSADQIYSFKKNVTRG